MKERGREGKGESGREGDEEGKERGGKVGRTMNPSLRNPAQARPTVLGRLL